MLNKTIISAINIVEGYEEGDSIEAWGLIIRSNIWQRLQGFYQRTVCQLISNGTFDSEGNYYGEQI
jgi:hypothetical protein